MSEAALGDDVVQAPLPATIAMAHANRDAILQLRRAGTFIENWHDHELLAVAHGVISGVGTPEYSGVDLPRADVTNHIPRRVLVAAIDPERIELCFWHHSAFTT